MKIVGKLFEDFGVIVSPDPGTGAVLPAEERKQVMELFREHGAVLFRHFAADEHDFVSFSSVFTSRFFSHGADRRKKIDEEGTVATAVLGERELSLHCELAYVPLGPEVVWFHCKTPPIQDGQTTLCDGVQFYERLSKQTRTLLERKKLKYRHNWGKNLWTGFLGVDNPEDAKRIIQTYDGVQLRESSNEQLCYDYVSSALKITRFSAEIAFLNSLEILFYDSSYNSPIGVVMDDDSAVPQEILLDIRETGKKVVRDLTWEKGDVLMFDNNRLMHGRRGFTGERTLHTRFGIL